MVEAWLGGCIVLALLALRDRAAHPYDTARYFVWLLILAGWVFGFIIMAEGTSPTWMG